ncbi:MAG: proline dehydrogenase family protein [Flavobacteriales bacterium]|nr:proline dehydrogenase family protein [Flavobacteriales bacterium]
MRGLPANDPRIRFAQLLGMSDNISKHGCRRFPRGQVRALRTRAHMLPYLIRRAQENTSAAGQMGRELKTIVAERARRKREK